MTGRGRGTPGCRGRRRATSGRGHGSPQHPERERHHSRAQRRAPTSRRCSPASSARRSRRDELRDRHRRRRLDRRRHGRHRDRGRARPGRGRAADELVRRRATARSRPRAAPVLAFCDADCRPEPDWLERGPARRSRPTDLVAGRIRFDVPGARTVWTLSTWTASKDHEHQVRVGLAETANLFLRRELFDRVGGLDGSIAEYGDYEFVERCVAAGARLTLRARRGRLASDARRRHGRCCARCGSTTAATPSTPAAPAVRPGRRQAALVGADRADVPLTPPLRPVDRARPRLAAGQRRRAVARGRR